MTEKTVAHACNGPLDYQSKILHHAECRSFVCVTSPCKVAPRNNMLARCVHVSNILFGHIPVTGSTAQSPLKSPTTQIGIFCIDVSRTMFPFHEAGVSTSIESISCSYGQSDQFKLEKAVVLRWKDTTCHSVILNHDPGRVFRDTFTGTSFQFIQVIIQTVNDMFDKLPVRNSKYNCDVFFFNWVWCVVQIETSHQKAN